MHAPMTTRPVAPDVLPDAAVYAVLEPLATVLGLVVAFRKDGRGVLTHADGTGVQPWRENYPYGRRLGWRPYRLGKESLQVELLKLQRSVKMSGQRLLIVFEGRDAAGKAARSGSSPKTSIRVAPAWWHWNKPAAHEHGANCPGRYLPHLPAPCGTTFIPLSV